MLTDIERLEEFWIKMHKVKVKFCKLIDGIRRIHLEEFWIKMHKVKVKFCKLIDGIR